MEFFNSAIDILKILVMARQRARALSSSWRAAVSS